MTRTTSNRPSHAVYVVEGEGESAYWTRIGAAWAHEDGDGLNLQLSCLPLTGRLVVRKPRPKADGGACPMNRTATIRRLNDALRQQLTGGRLLLTPGVSQLAPPDRLAVVTLVRAFRAFTPDSDPHGEHDFGSVEHQGTRYFWKIDYHDLELAMHSLDAADPAVTVRVLTLMRADEY